MRMERKGAEERKEVQRCRGAVERGGNGGEGRETLQRGKVRHLNSRRQRECDREEP